jgi:hypothetical protein
LELEKFGFDEHGQFIKGWTGAATTSIAMGDRYSVKRFIRDRRGFGHFIAIGMGVAAALVMFGVVWPAAKTMMNNTVGSMNSLNSQMISNLGGLTVTASGTTVNVTFPSGITPLASASDYTLQDSTSSTSLGTPTLGTVSGQTMSLTVTAVTSGDIITVSATNGSVTYTGTCTAS